MNTSNKNNPMYCDPETGMCEIQESPSTSETVDTNAKNKPVKLIYFTDPICSSCWGIEPQLKKLKLEYDDYFEIDYRMGGLLKSWDTYGGSDVNGPNSVAQHWDEASGWYKMPIDGNVWLEDPLDSSYPPSIAFKAAQIQSEEKAQDFMRIMREMVFLRKENIAKWENIKQAADMAGLDTELLKTDFDGRAIQLFEDDLALRQQLGVRGFPSIFFTDKDDNRFLVYGSKSYENYEEALLKLFPKAEKKQYDTAPLKLLEKFKTLTTMEFAVLANVPFAEAEKALNDLAERGSVKKHSYRNGELWETIATD